MHWFVGLFQPKHPQLRLIWHRKPLARRSPSSDLADVALTTQLSSDRLDRLIPIAKSWNGPVVAAVLLTGQNGSYPADNRPCESLARKQCSELCATLEATSGETRVELLLFRWCVEDPGAFYPVNSLRNFALSRAKAHKFVFQVDVDFVPSPRLRKQLGNDVTLALRLAPSPKISGPIAVALVVPALEMVDETTDCSDIESDGWDLNSVRQWMFSGRLRPMAFEQFPTGHRATDFGRWLANDSGNGICASICYGPLSFEEGFEPFVLLESSSAPYFDERLSGYGRNKCLQTFHLHALGFEFRAMKNACIIHLPHAPSDACLRTLGRATDGGSGGANLPARLALVKAVYRTAKAEMIASSAAPLYSPLQTSLAGSVEVSWGRGRNAESANAVDCGDAEVRRLLAQQNSSLHGMFPCDREYVGKSRVVLSQDTATESDERGIVTWSTHCSLDRLHLVSELCARWQGPLCCAVLVKSSPSEHARFADHVAKLNKFAKGRIAIIAVDPKRKHNKMQSYPANSLRSLSLSLVQTQFALIADVDFHPSACLFEGVKRLVPDLMKATPSGKFLVVPAFEIVEPTNDDEHSQDLNFADVRERVSLQLLRDPDLGACRSLLRQLHDAGDISLFHARHYPYGHGATDAATWLAGSHSPSYAIQWEEGFEPYGIIEVASAPPFDRRFDEFFAFDKVSFFAQLAMRGYTFEVFCHGFLLDQSCAPRARKTEDERQAVQAASLMRLKFREMRCAEMVEQHHLTDDWVASRACCCDVHRIECASVRAPPYYCRWQDMPSPGPQATQEAQEPLCESDCAVTASALRDFSRGGGGRKPLEWNDFSAALVGQVSPAVFGEFGVLKLDDPDDPLQLRLDLKLKKESKRLQLLTLRYGVCLAMPDAQIPGAARSGPIAASQFEGLALPGIVMRSGGAEVKVGLRLGADCLGKVVIFTTSAAHCVRRQVKRHRIWRLPTRTWEDMLNSPLHRLSLQAGVLENENGIRILMWVDGSLVYECIAVVARMRSSGKEGAECDHPVEDVVDGITSIQILIRPESGSTSNLVVRLGSIELFPKIL